MDEIKELVIKILNRIDEMTDLLYQEKVNDGYAILNQIISEMDLVIKLIAAYQDEHQQKIVDENKLLGSVEEAFKAMEEKDTVLLADIFSYDIKEQLEMIANQK